MQGRETLLKEFILKQQNSHAAQSFAIIILIAIFVIAGIISCSGDAVTGGGGNGNYSYWEGVPQPDETGPVAPTPDPDPEAPDYSDIPTWGDSATEPEPPDPTPTPTPKPSFESDTYVNIYAPFTKWDNETGYIKRVSYKDTNTLTELWKAHISGGNNDGKRWFIRDGDNHSLAYPYDKIVTYTNDLNYYYFDKNFDIVHAGKYAHRVKLKKFLGGVIVKYSRGKNDGTWTIGGLYQWVLNKADNNSQGQKGYTKYENDNLNEFMRAIHNWNEGDLSVILMNLGYNDQNHDQFGVDEYYCTVDNNYRRNPEYFLGQNPTSYLGNGQYTYWHEKLNVRINHSWNLSRFNFRFFSAQPLNWHLE